MRVCFWGTVGGRTRDDTAVAAYIGFGPGAALVALALVFSGGAGAAGPPDGNGLDHAIAIQEAHTDRLMAMSGVVGTGVGVGADGQPVIRVYVLSGAVTGLPPALDGVALEPVVTGLIVARACQDTGDPTERCDRPVPIGVSTGHPKITAGTIAARVTDGTNVFALSNNHVYADTNDANIGDQALQPGPADGGRKGRDKVGDLFAFEIIVFDFLDCTDNDVNTVCDTNTIDAAIAISSTDQLGNATLPAGYGTPNSATVGAVVNMAVQKCGRTTDCTQGTVLATNVTLDICYKPVGPFCFTDGIARFVDQIEVGDGNFSAPGDSGSLIVTNDANNNPVALLFAGGANSTFANPIDPVLAAFSVTIDDGTPAPTPAPTTPAPTPAPSPAPSSDMHVGDLDSESFKLAQGKWRAEVTIEVHDGSHSLVTGFTVTGTFTQNGDTIAVTCTDGDANDDLDGALNGQCRVDSGQFPNNSGNATFTVDSVTDVTLTYQLADNHDPDGESDGTTIQLSK